MRRAARRPRRFGITTCLLPQQLIYLINRDVIALELSFVNVVYQESLYVVT
jgi:hypothetical protein